MKLKKRYLQGDQTALFFKGHPIYRAFSLFCPVFALYSFENPVFFDKIQEITSLFYELLLTFNYLGTKKVIGTPFMTLQKP